METSDPWDDARVHVLVDRRNWCIGSHKRALMKSKFAAVVGLTFIVALPHAATAQCAGDCNSDSQVTVDELIVGVNVALGTTAFDMCNVFDTNGDGQVAVNELVAAVNNALNGCVSNPVLQGLAALSANNLRDANESFETAITMNPSDARATLLAIFTRIARVLLENTQLQALATRAGVIITGNTTNICDFALTVPDPLADGAPRTGELMDTGRTVLLPEITRAVEQLRQLPESTNVEFTADQLPECVRDDVPSDPIRVNHADILAMAAGFDAVVAAYDIVTAYNIDADLQAVLTQPFPSVLAKQLGLLTLLPGKASQVASARDRLDADFAGIIAALDTVSGKEEELADHVLGFLVGTGRTARMAKRVIDLTRQALRGEIVLPIDIVTGQVVLMDIGLAETERVDLSRFFAGQVASLRPLVPNADANGHLDFTTAPDPTFGGATPTLTTDKIANFLIGGPACSACADDSDCNAFGFGSFQCGPCTNNCTGNTSRCVEPFVSTECSDGTYGSLLPQLPHAALRRFPLCLANTPCAAP
jgi:hypothetical protein